MILHWTLKFKYNMTIDNRQYPNVRKYIYLIFLFDKKQN